MTGKVLAIRPEPGLSQTLEAGAAMGLDMAGFPLFEIQAVDWTAPDPSGLDGLLIGSANAFRHGGEGLEALKALPVYAVGQTTAQLARERGFDVAHIGEGGLANVVKELAGQKLDLLRLSGRERVALEPPSGISISERIVYEAVALPFTHDLIKVLEQTPLTLLHSAAAAAHFARQCDAHSIPRDALSLAAFGPRIAEAAGQGWREIRCAKAPNDAALLELARQMCQNR